MKRVAELQESPAAGPVQARRLGSVTVAPAFADQRAVSRFAPECNSERTSSVTLS